MEAARVARLRGHEVVLLEATDRLGGQINLAAKAPGGEEIAIAGWRAAELERLGVEVRLNSYAEAEDVVALEPDVVIVATGGMPDTAWLRLKGWSSTRSWASSRPGWSNSTKHGWPKQRLCRLRPPFQCALACRRTTPRCARSMPRPLVPIVPRSSAGSWRMAMRGWSITPGGLRALPCCGPSAAA